MPSHSAFYTVLTTNGSTIPSRRVAIASPSPRTLLRPDQALRALRHPFNGMVMSMVTDAFTLNFRYPLQHAHPCVSDSRNRSRTGSRLAAHRDRPCVRAAWPLPDWPERRAYAVADAARLAAAACSLARSAGVPGR